MTVELSYRTETARGYASVENVIMLILATA